jgi:N-acetylglutamate synthase-like GNAT family acetyltransferase
VRKQTTEGNPHLIRPAHADEAPAIVALLHGAFAEYRGKLQPEPGALSESLDTISSVMSVGTILVAVRDNRIAGCVAIQRKADFAYAGRLAVDPGARGAGVGKALMAAAESTARQLGARRLRVDVGLALTENRAFFRTLGFVEGGHRCHPGFSRPTYVELEKILI